jgi:hypothetical protein
MRTAIRTAGVGVVVGDEEGKDDAWPAIGNTVIGCGDGGERLLVKGRMNRGGRDEGSAEFSVEPAVGP